MSLIDSLTAVLVMALWGFNFVAIKAALLDFPPILLLALRFLMVAGLLLPFVRVPRDKLKGILLLSVVLGSMHFPLMFNGVRAVDAATGAILSQLQVPFSSLLAALVYQDYLGWRRALGMTIAFVGVMVIASGAAGAGGAGLTGVVLIIAACLAFSLSNIQIKRLGAVDGFALNAWMGLFAVPQLLVLSLLLEEGHVDAVVGASWLSWVSLVYIAVASTIVAYGLWFRLARVYPVNQTMPYMLLVPTFGVLSGVVVLGEPVTVNLIVGGVMTIAGVGVIMIRRPRTVDEKAASTT